MPRGRTGPRHDKNSEQGSGCSLPLCWPHFRLLKNGLLLGLGNGLGREAMASDSCRCTSSQLSTQRKVVVCLCPFTQSQGGISTAPAKVMGPIWPSPCTQGRRCHLCQAWEHAEGYERQRTMSTALPGLQGKGRALPSRCAVGRGGGTGCCAETPAVSSLLHKAWGLRLGTMVRSLR